MRGLYHSIWTRREILQVVVRSIRVIVMRAIRFVANARALGVRFPRITELVEMAYHLQKFYLQEDMARRLPIRSAARKGPGC